MGAGDEWAGSTGSGVQEVAGLRFSIAECSSLFPGTVHVKWR